MQDVVSGSAAQPKFYSLLLGLFAAVAMVLSAVGLYGVVSYAVSRHTREIGIRVALGATSGDIARLVAGQGLRLIALGLAAGLGGGVVRVPLARRLLVSSDAARRRYVSDFAAGAGGGGAGSLLDPGPPGHARGPVGVAARAVNCQYAGNPRKSRFPCSFPFTEGFAIPYH